MNSKIRNARNAIIVLLILTLPLVLHAQITFERNYGGPGLEWGYSVQQSADNGYVFTGATGSPYSDFDVYLIKTDSLGDTLWTRSFGGSQWDYGYSVQQTSDCGYILAGFAVSFSAGSTDVYLVKTDSLGDSVWTRNYGGPFEDIGYSVKQTSDNGYIIAGHTASFGAGGTDVYLLKTDSLGDTLWTRTYGGIDDDYGRSVQQTSDSGYIIAGYTWSFGAGGFDVYLIRTDSLGDTLWTKTYGWGAGDELGFSVQQTSDHGYIISGRTNHFSPSIYVYLIKTDSLGDTLWTRIYYKYQSEGQHCGYSVQQTLDGGYIIAGYAANEPYYYEDLYLIKTDSSGDTLWTRTYGGITMVDLDYGYSVKQTNDGGYIVAGLTYSFGNQSQAYLIKTDTLGSVGVQEKKDIRQRTQAINLSAHPNPFTSNTTISLYLPSMEQRAQSIELRIYDVAGRMVKQFTLLPTQRMPISATWDGRDNRGMKVKSGVYFIQLSSDRSVTSRVILIR